MSNYNVYFFLKALLVLMVVACPLVKTAYNHPITYNALFPLPYCYQSDPGPYRFYCFSALNITSHILPFIYLLKLSLDFITFNLIQANVLKQHNIVVKEHGLRSQTMWVHIWLYLIHY